jgi:integrase
MIIRHFMTALRELKKTVQNNQNRTETGQQNPAAPARRKGRLPKTHQDFWHRRLRKRSYVSPDGKTEIEIPVWQVRLFHTGNEGWFNLGTANQAAAAIKARDIYVYLKANGWAATLAKFKPDSDVAPRLNLTVGDFLAAVKATGYLRLRTFLNYQTCLRTIISESFGVKSDDSKYDYRHGGNKKWADRVNGIRLERMTPARVMNWQQRRTKEAGNSPVALASAKRTANSYVRCARSLFGKDILKRIRGIKLPAILPFDGVELFEAGNTKYVSKVDAKALISAARNELKPNEPEVYKAFLLGLFAGMRRAEIDLAEWRMVDWQSGVIKLEETDYLRLKTHDSAGEISIDPEFLAELRELQTASKSAFIISSDVTWGAGKMKRTRIRPPRNDSARAYYRCEPVFERLNEWLRSKGIKANKPLHELRKEIGAMIATEHGIYAASRFLRHSDITTTARHYADHKTRITVGLGKLLNPESKPPTQEKK